MCGGLGALVAGSCGAAPLLGPLDLSGYAGYTFRSLSDSEDQDDVSHQFSGVLNGATYFWQPWFSTADFSLTVTRDRTEFDTAESSSETDSQILTGDFGLNVFPQSRMPFAARLVVTDSRVDREEPGGTPITFVGQEYSTEHLTLRQSLLTAMGRFQARADFRSWESQTGGQYDDTLLGLEADVRAAKHRLTARGSYQLTEHDVVERENENTVLDISHFYYPLRNFRVDSKASFYDYDRSFLDPTTDDVRLSSTNTSQLSSFAFWRPEQIPLTVSGGLRLFNLEGSQEDIVANDQQQLAGNIGVFYQMTKKLRLDYSGSATFRDIGGEQSRVYDTHLGALYQSDWQFGRYNYHWYGDLDIDGNADPDLQLWSFSGALGHSLSRNWLPKERTGTWVLRFNWSQTARLIYDVFLEDDNDIGETGDRERFDNSVSLAWDQQGRKSSSLIQMTVSDSRDFGESENERQLVNLQLSRDQELGGKSVLTGDLTVQYVRLVFDDDESDTTTATGRLRYEHRSIFGVPRLRFTSDYMVSQISTDDYIDRTDWENALYYVVGKLDVSLSYRLTDTDGRDYDLLYFRAVRRF